MATKKQKKTRAHVAADALVEQRDVHPVEKKKKRDHKETPMRSSIGRYLNDKGEK